jgi:DNA-binding PadR family transcriptional regulator
MTEERKLLILGLLRMTDMHGYVLNAHIDSVSPITLKKPAAYNLLDSMERDGWIEHREESTGDRQRKVFSVTAAGERAFFELLRKQLGAYTPNESPSMVGLSFLDVLRRDEAIDLLRQKRASILDYHSSFESGGNAESEDPHSGSMQLPIEYARRLAELDLTFIDEIIQAVSKQPHRKEDDNG